MKKVNPKNAVMLVASLGLLVLGLATLDPSLGQAAREQNDPKSIGGVVLNSADRNRRQAFG